MEIPILERVVAGAGVRLVQELDAHQVGQLVLVGEEGDVSGERREDADGVRHELRAAEELRLQGSPGVCVCVLLPRRGVEI